MKNFMGLTFLFFSLSCATTIPAGMENNFISQSDYEKVLESSTRTVETYDGIYNTIHLTASLVRSQLMEAQLKQSARLYQWDAPKFQDEKTKKADSYKAKAEVFVSFFTPEKKNEDLQKSQTLWKIFLDVSGRRFEGKATKIKLNLTEVQGLYPYHNRFSTPYQITFPVTMQSLEGQEVKLTITGSVGSASVTF